MVPLFFKPPENVDKEIEVSLDATAGPTFKTLREKTEWCPQLEGDCDVDRVLRCFEWPNVNSMM